MTKEKGKATKSKEPTDQSENKKIIEYNLQTRGDQKNQRTEESKLSEYVRNS